VFCAKIALQTILPVCIPGLIFALAVQVQAQGFLVGQPGAAQPECLDIELYALLSNMPMPFFIRLQEVYSQGCYTRSLEWFAAAPLSNA
jgi:hypothetical protein